MTCEERIAIARTEERERIADWHDRQAAELEAAAERILREGGEIVVSHRSLVEVHRAAAKAIRDGALG